MASQRSGSSSSTPVNNDLPEGDESKGTSQSSNSNRGRHGRRPRDTPQHGMFISAVATSNLTIVRDFGWLLAFGSYKCERAEFKGVGRVAFLLLAASVVEAY